MLLSGHVEVLSWPLNLFCSFIFKLVWLALLMFSMQNDFFLYETRLKKVFIVFFPQKSRSCSSIKHLSVNKISCKITKNELFLNTALITHFHGFWFLLALTSKARKWFLFFEGWIIKIHKKLRLKMTFKKGFENVFHRKLIKLSLLKREKIESIKITKFTQKYKCYAAVLCNTLINSNNW